MPAVVDGAMNRPQSPGLDIAVLKLRPLAVTGCQPCAAKDRLSRFLLERSRTAICTLCRTMNLSLLNALNTGASAVTPQAKLPESGMARPESGVRNSGDFSTAMHKAFRQFPAQSHDSLRRQALAGQGQNVHDRASADHNTPEPQKVRTDRPNDHAQDGREQTHTATSQSTTPGAAEQLAHRPPPAHLARQGQTQAVSDNNTPPDDRERSPVPSNAPSTGATASDTEQPSSTDPVASTEAQPEASDGLASGLTPPAWAPQLVVNDASIHSATSSGTALKAVDLSPQMQLITPQRGVVSEQSLQAFARAMGFDEAQLQHVLGDKPSTAAPAMTQAALANLGNPGTTLTGPGQMPSRSELSLANLRQSLATPEQMFDRQDPMLSAPDGKTALINALNQALPAGFRLENLHIDVMSNPTLTQTGSEPQAQSTLSMLSMMEADLSGLRTETAERAQESPLDNDLATDGTAAPTSFGLQVAARSAHAGPSATVPATQNPIQTAEAYDQLSDRLATEMATRMNEQLSRGDWKMKFALKPASLGMVDVQLEMRDGKLAAVLQTDNPLTQDLLQNGSQRLRDALSQMGLNPSSVQVGLGQGQGQRGDRDHAQAVRSSRPEVPADSSDEIAIPAEATRRRSLSQLDFYA